LPQDGRIREQNQLRENAPSARKLTSFLSRLNEDTADRTQQSLARQQQEPPAGDVGGASDKYKQQAAEALPTLSQRLPSDRN